MALNGEKVESAMEVDWRARIVAASDVLGGRPVVRGTRLAVELVVELLAAGWSEQDILDNCPQLTREDIRACLAYAADLLRDERVLAVPA
jgi:uncharacterized protein (DUF433 family)